MRLTNEDAIAQRAASLEASGFNGLRFLLVNSLDPASDPSTATVELVFYNAEVIGGIVADITADPSLLTTIFAIRGGQRIRAGKAQGQVKTTDVAATASADTLTLTISPIGDYSTYSLILAHPQIDPLFSELEFRFRPGCFHHACAPQWKPREPIGSAKIDYLAKDYESFKHTLLAAMTERVPGWQPTSEADLDQVLVELIAAGGDELSDFQDRVFNEAYLGTARKRVSLVRHARLVDYHVHQGNQASTWLRLDAGVESQISEPFTAWARTSPADTERVYFATREPFHLHPQFNSISAYTWDSSIPAIDAGATEADLLFGVTTEAEVTQLRDLVRNGQFPRLLIQQHLNPATGLEPGADISKRQVLTLIPGSAEAREDPIAGLWYLHVEWEAADALDCTYCFETVCPDTGVVSGVSLFHGNLVLVHEGQPVESLVVEEGADDASPTEDTYVRDAASERYGVTIQLPFASLAYLPTPPGGEVAPRSTLTVTVEQDGLLDEIWEEQIDLVHSGSSGESSDHFCVETDEYQGSVIRFGNGVNGRALPDGANVRLHYQVGGGIRGNVGAGTVQRFDTAATPEITSCSNPFDVTGGREPETAGEVIRFAPEAYRARQLRAVTLQDYVDRAEELPGVSRASARYAWTGSWRTVQVTIDPAGTNRLTHTTSNRVRSYLDAVRLIGEDLEIREPRFVPIEIKVVLCLHPHFWPEDIELLLEQEFSATNTPDGRPGFFHPDQWTFGQSLHASQIAGRLHGIAGIDHIHSISLQRFNDRQSGVHPQRIDTAANEIILVENDPNSIERGTIAFTLKGGRQ